MQLDQIDHAMTAALRAGKHDEFERLAAQAEAARLEREARLTAPNALADAALWYARQGIAVFPLRPRNKKPYPGSNGFKDATSNPDMVRRWWTDRPQSNIGLPTGRGFDVIDIDGPPGFRSYADLRDRRELPPIIGRAFTQHGMHLYVPSSGDGNAARFLPGLDYRGAGGYVVAPPSIGDTGRRYDWETPLNIGGIVSVAA